LFFLDDKGAPAGLEYEILSYCARATGRRLEVEWVPTFQELLPALAEGKGDVAAGSLSVTPARLEKFDFTVPYFTVRMVLIEKRDRSTSRLEELRGEKLATTRGTTYEAALSRVPGAQLVYADLITDLLDLVAEGKARATAVDSLVALRLLPRYPGLKISLQLSDAQDYGFALPKGSPYVRSLSHHIELLKTSRIYYRLLEKYLGRDAAALVRESAHR
jgi:ABC-type amino acid transport substrate-binding protein